MKTIIAAMFALAIAAPALADPAVHPAPPKAADRDREIVTDVPACLKGLGFTQVWTVTDLKKSVGGKAFLVYDDGRPTTTPRLTAEEQQKCGVH